MSSYPFRILNTCIISALSLLNGGVGMPNVVSLMLYGSLRRYLDSLVALLYTPSTIFMSWIFNDDHIIDAYSTCEWTRAL